MSDAATTSAAEPSRTEPSPTNPDVDDDSNRNWWIALSIAMVFLIGAVGYLVGTRITQSSNELNTQDAGFLQDMIDHHDQAVTLGILGNERASDEDVRHFAMESIIFQRFQIGQMTELLANDGLARGDEDRTAMAWMGMGTSVETMPGMATQAQLDALADADPDEANRLFLELMQEHHRGGLHMAEYVQEHGSSPRVKVLAEQMERQQRAEIQEYKLLQEKLGYT